MSAALEANEADPNLTPLLDLVLQLIMFFMITVNFVNVDQQNANIVLPVAQAAVPLANKPEDEEWVYLNIDQDGKLEELGEDLRSPDRMKAFLRHRKEDLDRKAREERRTEPHIVVIIRAHQDARHGKVWEILDACQKAGFTRWQIRGMVTGEPGT